MTGSLPGKASRQKRHILWCGLLAATLIACKQGREAQQPAPVPDAVSVQELKGEWDVLRIDGNDVSAEGYWLVLKDGRVMGGYDGCNHWGRQFMDGQWLVVGTAVGCYDKASRQAYDAVASQMRPDAAKQGEEGLLLLTSAGHEIELQPRPAGASK